MTEQAIEPKTKLPCGIWFYNDDVWDYKGTLPVVMEFHNRIGSKVFATDNPERDRSGLDNRGRVKRWLVLPA